ncbi:DUF4238 domain-containing protein [Streptomyces narbonensis]|uniref:DUF4238 domain-containing protein n=1 Tax=Streptomyces narbonensis TaxID=67333 RepID=UPI00340D0A7A
MSKTPGQKPVKRRHHTVPKFYLSRFANERDQIIRVPLPGDKRATVSTKDASVVKDFYLLETEKGVFTDAVEDALSEVEGDAAEAFRAVVDLGQWPPTDEQRRAIAAWAATQHVRVPRVRQRGDEIADLILKMQVAIGGKPQAREALEKAEGREVTDEEVEDWWEEMTDFDSYHVTQHPNSHLRLMSNLIPRTARHFFSLPWGLIRFSRKALITADDPVVLNPRDGASPYEGVGLATAESFLVPLDRRVALVINNTLDVDDYEIEPTAFMANQINQMVALNAHRAIFHHPDDRPLDRLVIPEPSDRETNPSSGPRDFLMPDGWPAPGSRNT